MRNLISRIATVLFVSFSALSLNAQLVIDDSYTPEELVQDFFVGDGVEVLNVTFNGEPGTELNNQIGLFSNGLNDGLEIDSGLVMASASVLSTIGIGFDPPTNPITNDPDLQDLSGQNMNDCAILEFDFIPTGDSLVFRYVFASSEYSGFTCTGFNDVFGFFISGPGIDGGFTNNADNIALIPGTEIPVGVNTINGGEPTGGGTVQNCLDANPNFVNDTIYFVDNIGNINSSFTFNGYTVTLEAIALVNCLDTFHIKLAIGDALDGALDSGVFLEAGSFSSNALVTVDADPALNGVQLDSVEAVINGCTEAVFTFIRLNADSALGIDYEFVGTAIEGEDFFVVEDTVFFEEGEFETFITLVPIEGAYNAEQDSILLRVFSYSVCGDTLVDDAYIQIINDYVINTNTFDQVILCPQDSFPLQGSAGGGIAPYLFSWEGEGEGNPYYRPLPNENGVYEFPVEITDYCEKAVFRDTLTLELELRPDIIAAAGEDQFVICPDDPATLERSASNGHAPYDFIWSSGSTSDLATVQVEDDSTFTLIVVDICGTESPPDSVNVIVQDYDPLIVTVEDEFSICPNDEVTLVSNVIGGAGDLQFDWSNGTDEPNLTVNQDSTETFVLVVQDFCGFSDTTEATITVQQYDALSVESVQLESVCPGDTQVVVAVATGGAGSYEYDWNPGGATTQTITVAPEFTTNYGVTVTDFCGNTRSASMLITVPNNGIPTPFWSYLRDCSGETVTLQIDSIVGGAGDNQISFFEIGDPNKPITVDPNVPTRAVVTGPLEGETYTVSVTDFCEVTGELAIPLDSLGLNVPNAMTPNGDGRNDFFFIENLDFYPNAQLQVYNRWGNEVFNSGDYRNTFDADGLNLGTYFYVLSVQGGQCTFSGNLELIDETQ